MGIFILCHSLSWINNVERLEGRMHAHTKQATKKRHQCVLFSPAGARFSPPQHKTNPFPRPENKKMPTVTLLKHTDYKKEISLAACQLSGLMVDMLGGETEGELPFDTLTPVTMDKVLVFLEHHANNPMNTINKPISTNVVKDIVGEWDANFIALDDDQDTLVELILAANYLNCQSLLDLGILKIATMIKDKEPDQVKDIFHIDKDITPEEEKMVRENNMWVFELGEKKEEAAAGGQ